MSGTVWSWPARSLRVQLTTEGNYPDVVGGVTRWCDLLMAGLDDVDWVVLALGVTSTRASRRGIRIRYPMAGPCPVGSQDRDRAGLLIDALGSALFAEQPDPDALLAALLNVRESARIAPVLITRLVSEMLSSWAPGVLWKSHPGDIPGGAIDEAVAIVTAILDAASAPVEVVDVNLSATVGAAAVPGVLDRARQGTPLIAVEHGIYVREALARTQDSKTDPWSRWIVRCSAMNLASLTYRTASLVVGVSEANVIASRGLGADPSTTVCIPNGVAAPKVCPPVAGRCRIGSVGRVDPFKGVDLFVSSAVLVAQRLPGATFVHIGPVENGHVGYRQHCGRLAEHPALAGRMTFMGLHPEPPAILPELDVQVIPSRSEGLPFSLLEGMAAGRPIIATAVGGIPEVLAGVGLVVNAGDIEVLASGIEVLCRDLALARRLGVLAHAVAQDLYPIERMLEGYREAMKSVSRIGVAR